MGVSVNFVELTPVTGRHTREYLRNAVQVLVLAASALACAGALAEAAAPKAENRCGWFLNPTPGNAWLTDRDGDWIVATQGGHQADGDWPPFKDSQWVATNIHYGHGCACLKLVADPATRQVARILSARALPLKNCRQDPTLKEPAE